MTTHQIRLDDLLGKPVRDASGRAVGRIYDMRAEEEGGELRIVEYHVGAGAFLERLGVSLRTLLGLATTEPRKIPWERMDISDPNHPVLLEHPPARSQASDA